jgi:hypothetical protein
MLFFEKKNDRLLTAIIIIVSVAGILYFGYRAIWDNQKKNRENPFAYDIKSFKKSEKSLVHYAEIGQIKINSVKICGLTIGPEDNLYVSGGDSVFILNKAGSVISSFKTSGTARCLAVEKNRDIYLGMTGHIEVYDSEGVKKAQWEFLGEKAFITSITMVGQSVFAADAGHRIVRKFSKSGRELAGIGKKDEAKDIPGFVIPSPYFDVAADPDGFLWVVNPGRHSLENYTMDGNFRTSWGESSMKPEGFCGCCNPVHIAILADGSFVTAEKGILRIKVYSRLGKLVSIVAGPDQFGEGMVGMDLAVDSAGRIYVVDPSGKMIRIFSKPTSVGKDGKKRS